MPPTYAPTKVLKTTLLTLAAQFTPGMEVKSLNGVPPFPPKGPFCEQSAPLCMVVSDAVEGGKEVALSGFGNSELGNPCTETAAKTCRTKALGRFMV